MRQAALRDFFLGSAPAAQRAAASFEVLGEAPIVSVLAGLGNHPIFAEVQPGYGCRVWFLEETMSGGASILAALRHVSAILLLPFVVTVVLPSLLLTDPGDSRWSGGAGLGAWCVVLFARIGRGTLAPWDPTRRLVSVGPYRVVRNPMITGVALVLAGEALLWGSRRMALWLGAFVAINHVYFLAVEEPGLRRRFGESYRAYATQVPRWLPRFGRRSP